MICLTLAMIAVLDEWQSDHATVRSARLLTFRNQIMLQYDPLDCLPSAEDLPDSDDTPVDNELQDLIPGLLKAILAFVWADRMDWFFGVDMGIYYDPNQPAIVPDGFLSLGVERIFDENLRLSYVLWEEQRAPIMVLEVVSQKRRGEYSTKKEFYAQLEQPTKLKVFSSN